MRVSGLGVGLGGFEWRWCYYSNPRIVIFGRQVELIHKYPACHVRLQVWGSPCYVLVYFISNW